MNYYRNVEAMLYNYKKMQAEIKNIDIEINELRNDVIGCSANSFSEKTGPTYAFNSNVENEVISNEHSIESLEKKKHKLKVQVEKIDNALEILTEDEMELVELRYFNRLRFKAISQKININESYCIQLKSKIINKIINIIFI